MAVSRSRSSLAGVDPQFLIERAAQPVVCAKRIGLPAVAVQREHELRVDLLIQRVIGRQLFQLGHQLRMLPGRQPGLDQGPLDLQPEQIQPLCLLLQPGQTGTSASGRPRHSASAACNCRAPSAGSADCMPCRSSRSATCTSVPSSPRSSR